MSVETTMDYAGYVAGTTGGPLTDRTVTLRRVDTNAVVGSTVTDANGRWKFDDINPLPTEYKAEIAAGTTPQVAVKRCFSGDVWSLYVREKLGSNPAAIFNLPALANVYANTVPLTTALQTALQTPYDARYVKQAGDTMTGSLTITPAANTAAGLTLQASGTAGPDLLLKRMALGADLKNSDLFVGTDGSVSVRSLTDVGGLAGAWLTLTKGAGGVPAGVLVGAATNVTGPLTVAGGLAQTGGFAYLGSYAGGGLYPRAGTDLALAWNFGSGTRDISLWNTDTANTTGISFAFRQLLPGNTRRDLVQINADSRVFLTGPTEIKTDGARAFAVRNTAGTLSFGVEPDGTLRGRPIANSAVLSGGVYGHIPFLDKETSTLYYIPLYRP